MTRHYLAEIGFVHLFIFPGAALWLAILRYMGATVIPLTAIVLLYPLGLLSMVIYSMILHPEEFLHFLKGARYGVIVVFIFSLPVVWLLSQDLSQSNVAWGIFAISLGSLWLPYASMASAYGRVLTHEPKTRSAFEQRAKRSPLTPEKFMAVFLAAFLGKNNILSRMAGTILVLVFLAFFYTFGWIILAAGVAYPLALFGVMVELLVLISSYISYKERVDPGMRQKLYELLQNVARC